MQDFLAAENLKGHFHWPFQRIRLLLNAQIVTGLHILYFEKLQRNLYIYSVHLKGFCQLE